MLQVTGNESFEELLVEFTPLIQSRAARFDYPYPGFDDLCQEGRIALWVESQRWDGKGNFAGKATVAIWHRMLDAIASARATVRNGARWSERSLDAPRGDGELALAEIVADPLAVDAAAQVIIAEEVQALVGRIKTSGLSSLERSALVLRALGYRQVEIAKRLNTSPGSVNTALNRAQRRLGIVPLVADPPADEIVRLYRGGASSKAIAEQFGVSDGTVRRICKRHNVPIRKRGQHGSQSLHRMRAGL